MRRVGIVLAMLCCGAPSARAAAAPAPAAKPAAKAAPKATVITAAPEAKKLYTTDEADDIFAQALNMFHDGDYDNSANTFYMFLTHTNATFDNYGWAQFFMAENFNSMGLVHAAVTYYYLVAKTRIQPEVIGTSLERLEEISRTKPFDEDLVYNQLIYDSDFGVLPPQIASWVGYVQGYYDYLHAFNDWGDRHFKAIDPNSPYRLNALYLQAVHAVRERRDNEALDLIQMVLSSPVSEPLIKNQARLALARLLFERSEFQEAIENYNQVNQVNLSYEQGLILTEKAWSAYYVNDYVKALGFLQALGAPSYESFVYADMYLLKAIIYKDLCHYLAAKNVVRAFRFRYGRALEQLKQRQPVERIERIRRAAIMEGPLARRTRFLQSLRHESEVLSSVGGGWSRSGLLKHAQAIYAQTMKQQNHVWQKDFKKAADRVALRLLDTAEQINVLDYETNLEVYKPLEDRQGAVAEEAADSPDKSTNVYYEFDGEYWNDELHDYQVMITSRCMGKGP